MLAKSILSAAAVFIAAMLLFSPHVLVRAQSPGTVDNENPAAVQRAEVQRAIAQVQDATPLPSATVRPNAEPEKPLSALSPATNFPEFPGRPPTLLIHTISDLLNRFPLVGILLLLILIDICMGTLAAFVAKRLSSNVSWRGMTKKAASLLVLGMVAAVEPLTGLPLAKLVALFYIWTEAISIVEAAAALGVPLPAQLLDALEKLKAADRIPLPGPVQAPAPAPGVTINTRGPVSVRGGGGGVNVQPGEPGGAERTDAINRNTAATEANTSAVEAVGTDGPTSKLEAQAAPDPTA